MPFKDSAGLRGRPRIAARAETTIVARPQAKSIRKLAGKIHVQIKDGALILDVKEVLTPIIRIKKVDAINFAEWILFKYK